MRNDTFQTALRLSRRAGFVAAVALVAAACDQGSSGDGGIEAAAAALELDNGGLDMEDEAPMFGEPDLFVAAELAEDVLYDDAAIEGSDEVEAMMDAPDAVAYHVRIAWGMFPGDSSVDEDHDWGGAISVNRGAIVVRRTVRFEDATDRVLDRTSRLSVEFTSRTGPHNDGLLLQIVDPPPAAEPPLVLTYQTPDGTLLSTTLTELTNGPYTEAVDDLGNRIVVSALARPADVCNSGFLRGRWHRVADELGRFRGRVTDGAGDTVGAIRGVYGQRANGDKVFFGKYVDRDGRFKGIFAGRYDDGHFAGRWHHRSGERGALGGLYRESIPGPEAGGQFLGRWAETTCNINVNAGRALPELHD